MNSLFKELNYDHCEYDTFVPCGLCRNEVNMRTDKYQVSTIVRSGGRHTKDVPICKTCLILNPELENLTKIEVSKLDLEIIKKNN